MLRQAMTYLGCGPTLTAIRQVQLSACEERLTAYPTGALFDEDFDDRAVQALYDLSYYSIENPVSRLLTAEELRQMVLDMIPTELAFLSMREYEMLTDLYQNHGFLFLKGCEDLEGAESLIRRLWVGLGDLDGMRYLSFPKRIADLLADTFDSKGYGPVRDESLVFEKTIHRLIYLNGVLPERLVHSLLYDKLCVENYPKGEHALRRMIDSAFDCACRKDGTMFLIHPALIDLDRYRTTGLFPNPDDQDHPLFVPDQEILRQEVPLHDAMCGALYGAVRPEYNFIECAEDLRFLIKQGISLEETEKAMASFLVSSPTEYMHQVLGDLYRGTPRWPCYQGVLN